MASSPKGFLQHILPLLLFLARHILMASFPFPVSFKRLPLPQRWAAEAGSC